MPNFIGTGKPFNSCGRNHLCYVCRNPIIDGDYNWTFNPRTSSKGNPQYRHHVCNVGKLWTSADYVDYKQRNRSNPTQVNPTPPPTPPITPEPEPEPIVTPITDITLEPVPIVTPAPKPNAHILDPLYNQPMQHFQAKDVLNAWKKGQTPFLHGAPGSGKTTLIENFAKQLNLTVATLSVNKSSFKLVTCSPDMSKVEIVGAISPLSGQYIIGQFRPLWEHGGFILFDECGLAPGSFHNTLNAMLAQRVIHFPDGSIVAKHANCFIVFADNSNLHGDDPAFPERDNAGSAFRNRLRYILFEYDEELESQVAHSLPAKSGFVYNATYIDMWIKLMHKVRDICKSQQLPISASPRVTYAGAIDIGFALSSGQYPTQSLIMDTFYGSLFEGLKQDVIGAALTQIKALPEFLAFARY